MRGTVLLCGETLTIDNTNLNRTTYRMCYLLTQSQESTEYIYEQRKFIQIKKNTKQNT